MRNTTAHSRPLTVGSLAVVAALALSGCSGSGDANTGGGAGTSEEIGISLIVKTTTNPFFVSMQEAAESAAEEQGVNLTLAAGTEDGDEDTQIQAIENAISRGDQGILITPNGPAVLDAVQQARDAGIYVIALDTAPDPTDAVDITFATNNFDAGQSIGEWAAAQLDGKPAVIALIDLFDDTVVSVDYNRDQGFLTGMGIDTADETVNGDEEPTGTYSGGSGGQYTIVGNAASNGAEDGGRTAMETLLSQNSDINVVYTINEPAAFGAYQALEAAGIAEDTILVSVDGGCAGVSQVADGTIGATAQQYPSEMAQRGMEAIVKLVESGDKPQVSEGLNFYDTGSALVTDTPVDGLESITSKEAAAICWGEQ